MKPNMHIEDNVVQTDVLIVGGGPSGLATAIHLANLMQEKQVKKRILLIEKGAGVGSHILSGAIIKHQVFRQLLNEKEYNDIPFDSKVSRDAIVWLGKNWKFKLPFHPPYMGNKGNQVASLSHICRYLAKIAEEKGVEIYPGFAVNELIFENNELVGVKTNDTGVDEHGNPLANYQKGSSIKADLIIFAEGSKGTMCEQLIKSFQLDKNRNEQMYSLGCKELWQLPEKRLQAGEVYHTMGFPLSMREFGGGFIYGLKENKVALGLVVGLDYQDPTFDIHHAFQIWKTHPFIKKMLAGAKLLEYGAKTLPEGGYYAIPKLYVPHGLIVGDSAGFLAMPALKGIHLAVYSGMLAAKTALHAIQKHDFSADSLSMYEKEVINSKIYKELYATRNVRQAFSDGLLLGGIQFVTQLINGGAGLRGRLRPLSDKERTRKLKDFKGKSFQSRFHNYFEFDKELTFDKVTDVYYSHTHYDEQQEPHLKIPNPEHFRAYNIETYGAPCQYFCPAECYELRADKNGGQDLRLHPENCLQCKTCTIKSPDNGILWCLPNGDNGPDYRYM